MKELFVSMAVVIAFGASGRLVGIDAVPYESREDQVAISLEHYEPIRD